MDKYKMPMVLFKNFSKTLIKLTIKFKGFNIVYIFIVYIKTTRKIFYDSAASAVRENVKDIEYPII